MASDQAETVDKYKRFQIIQAERHQEQAHFWNRFTAFSTLHAGLFVLATSTNVVSRELPTAVIALVGIVLAGLWAGVQSVSLHYVDRWKPDYHKAREALNFHFPENNKTDPRFSSTDMATCVPFIVLFVWILQIVLVFVRHANTS